MLNEEKIKLMTGISMFEKKEGKWIFPINNYFKGDYISNHLLRSFLGYTLCWLLGAAVWALYNSENLLNQLVVDNIMAMVIKIGCVYGIGLILYLFLTFRVYSKRYSYASRGLRVYVAKLRRLEKRYGASDKTKETAKGGQ